MFIKGIAFLVIGSGSCLLIRAFMISLSSKVVRLLEETFDAVGFSSARINATGVMIMKATSNSEH